MKRKSPPRNIDVIELIGPSPALDSEFKPGQAEQVFAEAGLRFGQCIASSKSGYRDAHKRHLFIPNANVLSRDGKVWWGDLDILIHGPQLEKVAKRLGCRLYVLGEHDGRWKNAGLPFSEAKLRAIWHTGGKVRPSLSGIRESGLPLSMAAKLLGIRTARLLRPQFPYIALQIDRRWGAWEGLLRTFTAEVGVKRWGNWFIAPDTRFGGKAPAEMLATKDGIELSVLFPDICADDTRLERVMTAGAFNHAIELQYGRIDLRWPPRPIRFK